NDAKAVERRGHLLASLDAEDFDSQYEMSNPKKENRWSFRPSDIASAYLGWPKVINLCVVPPYNGPVERRGFALISMGKDLLADRISSYFDETVSDDEIKNIHSSLMMTGNRIIGPEARKKILNEFQYDESRIVRYPFKPWDVRWCYLDNLRPLFSEPSPQLLNQRFSGNSFFITRDTADKDPEGPPFFFSSVVCDYDFISGHARHFPLFLKKREDQKASRQLNGSHILPGMEQEAEKITANLSLTARAYLASLNLPNPDTDRETAEMIWYHALAVGYSPAYLDENADGIRQDWPRIPLPQAKEALIASAALGRRVAGLLDTETPVPGVTAGKIPEELKPIAVFQCLDGSPARPENGDLDLTAGWGHAGKGGVTMPGKGKPVRRDDGAYDIFLNEEACWRNVSEAVWEYTIGGYQVIKKWLSYREKSLLGRGLTPEEVRYVTEMARRLTALVALRPDLDANYRDVIRATYPWQQT
ncbi:MAG: DNA methyltransferase, partial [Deltaproteobacteria bacterium]|nr:DNA methyltransferase [Deltaproteobacteria bacterium]